MLTELEKIQRRIDRFDAQTKEKRAKLVEQKLKAAQSVQLTCMFCKRESDLGDWVFVQKYWYERPHGCTGGDEWWPSNTELCDIVCPCCMHGNYIYNHSQRSIIVNLADDRSWNKEVLFIRVDTLRSK